MRRIITLILAACAGSLATSAVLHKTTVPHKPLSRDPYHYVVDPNGGRYKIHSDRGVDGYIMNNADINHSAIQLNVHMYRTVSAFNQSARAHGVPYQPGIETQGFTVYRVNNNVCDMYIYDPAYRYKPEFIGHELVHCIYGDFHQFQNVGTPKK